MVRLALPRQRGAWVCRCALGSRCEGGLRVSGNNSVVECDLAKVEVAGSNPVSRSNIGTSPPVAAPARFATRALRRPLRSARYWLDDGAPWALLRASLRRRFVADSAPRATDWKSQSVELGACYGLDDGPRGTWLRARLRGRYAALGVVALAKAAPVASSQYLGSVRLQPDVGSCTTHSPCPHAVVAASETRPDPLAQSIPTGAVAKW